MMEAAPGAANNLDCIVTSTRLDVKASAPPDADDIAKLWIDTGLGDALTAEHVYSIPIGKPRDFFRTHPDSAYRARAEIYVQKSENVIGEQFYQIGPSMRGRIDEARPCILVCVVDRTGASRLWPIMLSETRALSQPSLIPQATASTPDQGLQRAQKALRRRVSSMATAQPQSTKADIDDDIHF